MINLCSGDVSDKYEDINLFREHIDQPMQRLSGLMKIPDLDLEKQEGSKNGSFEVKKSPVVADISEVGHTISTEVSVASAGTYAERVVAPLAVKHDTSKGSFR